MNRIDVLRSNVCFDDQTLRRRYDIAQGLARSDAGPCPCDPQRHDLAVDRRSDDLPVNLLRRGSQPLLQLAACCSGVQLLLRGLLLVLVALLLNPCLYLCAALPRHGEFAAAFGNLAANLSLRALRL